MKNKIHPRYKEAEFKCSCGNTIKTRATSEGGHIEICDQCHPFYTGKQKFIDSAGRIERFRKKFCQTTL
jgi:large subunit ribosomal protein L31